MARGAFVPALTISVPSVTALESLTLADVPLGTVATTLDTGDTYAIGGDGTWAAVSGGGAGITALTGGVTASGTGSVPATVHDLPLDATAIAAPATPAAGKAAIYPDLTSKNLCIKDDAGVVKHGVQTQATAGLFVSTISDAGVVGTMTRAQALVLLNPVYFVQASGSQQYLEVTGLNGDVDGDYVFEGQYTNGHSGASFTYQPNSQASNISSFNGNMTIGGVYAPVFNCNSNNAGAVGLSVGNSFTFRGTISVKTGRTRYLQAFGFLDTGAAVNQNYSCGVWTDTATNMTSFRIASGFSDAIAAGSWLRLTALGRS